MQIMNPMTQLPKRRRVFKAMNLRRVPMRRGMASSWMCVCNVLKKESLNLS
jgi:hypothetical protein